ncbi:amino acid adenylation domain-containing protein [Tumebacillus sp. ITR2]|uniref:Amino acid adenylation domain-containing protein n=1 Tax=Tumebacillus amylolyticus TaxID=2801339 RepID=A0ABS1JEE8_9BACL|nr:non-ribosomal peptide synthetase [Tumebacillus amylolyticus]MBL0388672.1 amino acid adenylation domain-containing protein [Tumebacillus amylolyticus]
MIHPLTHPQKRIWYIEQTYPGTPMYNIGGAVRVQGRVHLDVLEQAISRFIQSHEGVRLQLTLQNGEVGQYVADFTGLHVTRQIFQTEVEFETWARAEFETPFELYDSPLFSFTLFEVKETLLSGYFVKLHHIVADGWSVQLMTNQILAFYEGILQGERATAEDAPRYLARIEREQAYLDSPRSEKNRAYWCEKFRTLPDGFLLKSTEDVRGQRKVVELDSLLSERIREFTSRHGLSLNSLFVSLMVLYLHKRTQAPELILGIPVLNRSGAKEKATFGMFTGTMPLRVALDDEWSNTELLKQVQAEITASLFHQRYPFDKLVQDIELKKRGYESLFQVSVNTYNTQLNRTLHGYALENQEFYSGYQPYSLQLVVKEWSGDGRLTLFFDTKCGDFTERQVEELAARMLVLLEDVIAKPDDRLSQLSLVSAKERHDLLEGRNQTQTAYPREKTIVQLFEEQTIATPDRVAVRDRGRTWTYKELNEKANQLASSLPSNSLVAVLSKHSAEVVAGLLAVLKSGSAYVPLDPEHPATRICEVLEDSEAEVLLTDGSVHIPKSFTGQVIVLGTFEGPTENTAPRARPEDLAYLIYTSGSTGKPKGAMIEHRGLVNYITWAANTYAPKKGQMAFPLYSSLAFDLTVTSIFTPLICGGEVIVYREDGTEFVLHRVLRENCANVLKLTPAHLAYLNGLDLRESNVEKLIVGGEDLKASLASGIHQSFGGDVEIYNEYGPTETVVGCMIHRYDPSLGTSGSVPIGVPIQNTQLYVLDEQGQPVPDGMSGEIHIGGDGVARGYLHRAELTRERFVENSFRPGTRMYKTGDLARWLPSGVLEYLGRRDHQVKIRGHRIELGEIENELLAHEDVREAVVMVREDERGQNYLVAYFIPEQPATPQKPVGTAHLRRHLIELMPAYMVPSYLLSLEKFPLTANGKIDRDSLPDPLMIEEAAPRTEELADETQEILIQVLRELLQVEEIKPRDNFYFLGGDSVKAIQLASKLREHGLHIAVKDVLAYPVICELAAAVEHRVTPSAPQKAAVGEVLPTPILSWFARQRFPLAHHWNQSVLLRVQRDIQVAHLQSALDLLVAHHDSLRLTFNVESNRFAYAERLDSHVPLQEVKTTSDWLPTIAESVKASMNLETGPVFQAALFELGPEGRRLLLTAHHIAVDAVSWRILLEDLSRLCTHLQDGTSPRLPEKSHTVQAFAERLHEQGGTLVQEELSYWKEVDGDGPLSPELEPAESERCERRVRLLADETQTLLTTANVAYSTQTNDLLVTALALALRDLTGHTNLVIELEGHGRESLFPELDLTRTVGWFTSMYPVRLQLPSSAHSDPGTALKAVKEHLHRIPQKGIGYGILREVVGAISTQPRRDVRFNYLGEFSQELPHGGFSIAEEESGVDVARENPMTCGLDIQAMVQAGQLEIKISSELYRSSTVESLLQAFLKNLRVLLDHCGGAEERMDITPSDFDTLDLSQDELDGLFE